jgi:hypothetical protein
MKRELFSSACLLTMTLLLAIPASAQESETTTAEETSAESESTTEQEATEKPDYSRKALLEVFRETPEIINQPGPFDSGIIFQRGSVRYRWMPIVAPLLFGGLGGSPDTTPMPVVDPVALTGMSYPYDAGSYRDRWQEWRVRRMLRRNVAAANRADNE